MWTQNIADLNPPPSAQWLEWLQKPKNLGAALRQVCQHLSLTILEQGFNFPFPDEYAALKLADKQVCYLRKILLLGDGVPLSYGRVIVPKAVYLNHQDEFNNLNKKLLGETLLYSNPKTIRSSFEYQQVTHAHPLFYSIMNSFTNDGLAPDYFWARRSIFYMEGIEPLLVIEVFLKELPVDGLRI